MTKHLAYKWQPWKELHVSKHCVFSRKIIYLGLSILVLLSFFIALRLLCTMVQCSLRHMGEVGRYF